jgi:NTE family protein
MAASDAQGVARGWMRGWLRRLGRSSNPINLALQGGGAHGAFTWGVLDALLADPRIELEGISGSSAGAMNAVVLAGGWTQGGRDGARQALADFWSAVGRQMPASMVTTEGDAFSMTPLAQWFATWAGYFSPSQLNPLDLNPLRDLVEDQIDFERLRAESPFKLFVAATHASTGKLRLFRERELTADMLLASACLPRIHHTVEIDGEPYWDGAYSANPAVFPLVYDCASSDLLLVLLSPLRHEGPLRTRGEIETRIAEIGFTAHLMREMLMFGQVMAFARPSYLAAGRFERRLRRLRFHMIEAGAVAQLHHSGTKQLAYGPFLEMLRDEGRVHGQAWLQRSYEAVGRRSTVDLKELFA